MLDMVNLAPSTSGVDGFGLDAQFAATLANLLRVCRNAGYEFRVAQGLRTPQIQAEYYCKWTGHSASLVDDKVKFLNDNGASWLAAMLLSFRDIPRSKAKLTGQLPGSGWHQWGLAADAYCYRNGKMVESGDDPCYKFYADEAKKLGLTAGYYFQSRDAGHVQGPSADGAQNVYTWAYIDGIMKERFSPKTAIALPRNRSRASIAQPMAMVTDALPSRGVHLAAVAVSAQPASPPSSIPPAANEADITINGTKVYGPGNIVFGTVKGPGLYNFGTTTLGDFLRQDPHAFPDASPSLINVIRSVSENEGKIEAINTYDNAFLSVGIFQWTAGGGGDAGELAGLLDLVRTRSPNAFATYFGSVGLDVAVKPTPAGALRSGYLLLNGQKLDTQAEKAILRQPIWAYRFWRAAHDPEVRRAQVALAMARISAFYERAVTGKGGLTITAFFRKGES